ncbi:hypothetical protein [Escherichia phage JSS1]|uniref:Uncharacterized protein n=1 Tax=Escherichia phage JSS1 TaxID=1897443 RepID=A0A1I9SEA2_9CAUD|nr:hypothetical protein [Escherichia phage JSS1]
MKFTVIALYIAIILSWLTAVIVDGNALRLGWLAVDIIFSPVGGRARSTDVDWTGGIIYEYWTLGMLISGHLSDSLGDIRLY